jgi:glycerophosphoryl diester phosphodiesterase
MPYVVGHRGAAGLLPENTLVGFRQAIQLGCDYVECDVHLSRDKHLVVIHDHTVDRTTNGKGAVAKLSLAELRRLDAGDGQQIPLLAEVLEVIRGHVTLLCELKGPFTPEATARAVVDAGLAEQVIFTSFDFGRLARIKQLDPSLRTGATFGQPPPDALEQALALGAISVGLHFETMTVEFVEQARCYGLNLRAWNPDSEADIQRMIDLDPPGISSNRPDRVLKLLGRLSEQG